MKKIDSILAVASILERCHSRYGKQIMSYKNMAEEVMETIEELGMLPPSNLKGGREPESFILNIYRWEDEDEEK